MDTLTFVAEMTKAPAWPVVAVAVAWLARRPVIALVPGPAAATPRGGQLGAEFSQGVQEVKHALAGAPGAPAALPPMAATEADPVGVILRAWLELESMVLVEAQKLPGFQGKSFEAALAMLVHDGRVSASTAEALRGLRTLRNLAVHAPAEEKLVQRAPGFVAMAEGARFNLEIDLKKAAP